MVDGNEDGGLSFLRPCRGHVGAPHDVDRVRDDRAIMVARSLRCARPRGGEEIVFTHQAQCPAAGRAHARDAQSYPDLAVSLTMKRAGRDDRTDAPDQFGVRHGACRVAPPQSWFHLHGRPAAIECRPTDVPDPADRRQSIGATGRGGDRRTHGRSLRRAKGRPVSRAAIFSRSSSRSIMTSPSFASRRSLSSVSPSV